MSAPAVRAWTLPAAGTGHPGTLQAPAGIYGSGPGITHNHVHGNTRGASSERPAISTQPWCDLGTRGLRGDGRAVHGRDDPSLTVQMSLPRGESARSSPGPVLCRLSPSPADLTARLSILRRTLRVSRASRSISRLSGDQCPLGNTKSSHPQRQLMRRLPWSSLSFVFSPGQPRGVSFCRFPAVLGSAAVPVRQTLFSVTFSQRTGPVCLASSTPRAGGEPRALANPPRGHVRHDLTIPPSRPEKTPLIDATRVRVLPTPTNSPNPGIII